MGIRHVLVNGTIALRDGAPTGERAGMALRRTRHMPGRPPSTGTAATELTTPGLTLDVRQGARDVRARGTFRVKNAPGLGSIDMEEFGVLQTAAGWASFTGLARVGTRGTLAVTVIVDRSAVSADGPAVIVQIERRGPFAIAIAAPATP